jgi:hypothetical protein
MKANSHDDRKGRFVPYTLPVPTPGASLPKAASTSRRATAAHALRGYRPTTARPYNATKTPIGYSCAAEFNKRPRSPRLRVKEKVQK